jgi:hypothetical protein
METLGKWLREPDAIILLVLILVLFALFSAIVFEVGLQRLSSRLKKATSVVGDELEVGVSLKSLGDRIEKVFSGDQLLSREWAAYVSGISAVREKFFSSQAPEQYFGPARALQRPEVLNYRAVPGILVGLGLVFTFLGIAVVIHQASTLKGAEELPKVLAPAALKFWTSLAGVALSLITAFHFRLGIRKASESAIIFSRLLSTVAPPVGSIHIFQELCALRSEIGTPTEDAIREVVEHAKVVFDVALEKAHGAVKNSAQLLSDQAVEMQSEFEKIVENVFKCCEALKFSTTTLTGELKDASGHLRDGMDTATSFYSKTLGIAGEKLRSELAGAATAFEGSIGETVTKVRADFGQIAKDTGAAKRNLSAVALDAEKAGKSLQKIEMAMEGLAVLGNQLNELGGLPGALLNVRETLQETSANLSVLWGGYVRRLEVLDKQLAGSLSELPKSFQQYAESLEGYTRGLDQHLDKSLVGLMEWVQRIEEIQSNRKN